MSKQLSSGAGRIGFAAALFTLLHLATSQPVAWATGTPPTVEFITAPAPADTVPYLVQFAWQGHDTDGVVDHYRYAIDPPAFPFGDTLWSVTPDTTELFLFRASSLDLPLPPSGPITFSEPHTLVLEAVDDKGLQSAPVSRDFYTSTVAPDIQITQPTPQYLSDALIGSSVTIEWAGNDPDGVFSNRPVKYKYILLGPSSDFPVNYAMFDPDSLRRYYAPGFPGWDSTSAETTSVHFTNLLISTRYVFVVVAFDEVGAYSARFSLTTNMLRMRPSITPVLVSLVSAEADDHGVRVRWSMAGDHAVAGVYRRTAETAWTRVATVTADGSGLIVHEDRAVSPGTRYGYRVGIPTPTGEQFLGETWVTVPAVATLSLDGLRPNPADRELVVSFSLPTPEPAIVELVDLSGRIVARQTVDAKAGSHLVNLRDIRRVTPGLYLVRLSQAGRSVVRKACVVR